MVCKYPLFTIEKSVKFYLVSFELSSISQSNQLNHVSRKWILTRTDWTYRLISAIWAFCCNNLMSTRLERSPEVAQGSVSRAPDRAGFVWSSPLARYGFGPPTGLPVRCRTLLHNRCVCVWVCAIGKKASLSNNNDDGATVIPRESEYNEASNNWIAVIYGGRKKKFPFIKWR